MSDPWLQIPEGELSFTASRSGGPGGQNVNKVNSKVMVAFDFAQSSVLTDEMKEKIRQRLATRINSEGLLQVTSQRFRTQNGNREAAVARLHELIVEALHERRLRRKTRVPKGAKENRIQEKKQRSGIKRDRKKLDD